MRFQNSKHSGLSNRLGINDGRLIFMMAVIFLAAFATLFRVFYLQVLRHDFYAALASGQHEIYKTLLPERGTVYTQDTRNGGGDLQPLATNREFFELYAQPKDVKNPSIVAGALIDFVFEYNPDLVYSEIDKEKEPERYKATVEANNIIAKEKKKESLIALLSKEGDPYEPIKYKMTEEQKNAIESMKLSGVYFAPETYRYYPEKNIGSNISGFVGFVNEDRVGQYGIEGYFEKDLKGEPGYLRSERDAFGRWITLADKDLEPAKNGANIVLTIDSTLEYYACKTLDEHALRHGADAGSVIIMDTKTGAILAMCSYPDFDPNEYSKVKNSQDYNNKAIFAAYEPGSIFKPLTMAAAIDQGKVTPNTTYVDEGLLTIDGHPIRNALNKTYGLQNMIDVLNNSINTGAIFAARQIGPDLFKKYMEDFGLGVLAGIELDKEVSGNISSLSKKGEVYMATASFGQGVTATPLQMVSAYNAIANGGKLMAPYIVDRVVESDGTAVITKPQALRQVISQRAATLVSGMMVSVVRDGHAKRAGVPGYYIAGKTGTAQVAGAGTGKYGDRTIHSVAGFGPVDDPKFTMIVRLDDPKDVPFADSSAAPLFGDLAKFVLNYYEIPPDEPSSGK